MNKYRTVCKDVLIYFYLVIAIQTLGILCREKALLVLFNGSMTEDSSSCPNI